MSDTVFTQEAFVFETSGSCALAPEPQTYLRLVGEGELIPFARRSPVTRASEGREVEPQSRRKLLAGMLTAFVALALLFGALVWTDIRTAQALSTATSRTSFEAVTVHKGDNLWTLAAEHGMEGLSTAQVVSVIEEHNGLQGGLIHPGDTIYVPVG